MKNRTIIGIICMALAVVMTFVVAPIVTNITSDTTKIVRLTQDVKQGSPITEDVVEVVKVDKDSIPAGAIEDKSDVVGKYAASNLYTGDFFTKEKSFGKEQIRICLTVSHRLKAPSSEGAGKNL